MRRPYVIVGIVLDQIAYWNDGVWVKIKQRAEPFAHHADAVKIIKDYKLKRVIIGPLKRRK